MKKKENKGTGSHGIGNRTVIGIICIVAALLICFGVAPVVNRISDGKVAIVRVVRQVEAGAVIGADDVAVVEVGRHNLPGGLVTKTKDVIGKCVKSDLYAGDYILKDKLTGTEKTAKRPAWKPRQRQESHQRHHSVLRQRLFRQAPHGRYRQHHCL